ncbi:probable G-protein coupled receptor No9 [Saccostrea echinata]|uniref:probable G-protein coupled receptor No9 n=1 Tax=Saccostrea echinata TaxID=191078 RepID=UPI002A815F73|nr:probable G-protein coupled receptor No9 [Saccostrea echinata]
MVIFAMALYRRRLNTPTNIFIVSLALADLSVGITTLPIYAFHYFSPAVFVRYKYLCILKYSSILFSMSSSMYNLTAIAVDRYIAILYPLRYTQWITSSIAKRIAIGTFVYNLLVMCVPYVWHNNNVLLRECDFFKGLPKIYTVFVSFGTIFILLTVCSILYARVFHVIIRNRKRNIERQSRQTNMRKIQLKKETKSATVMGFVLFLFFAFWFPFLICGPLRYTDLSPELVELIKSISVLIAQSNSAVNPIIYCWLKPDFAWAFKNMIQRCYFRGHRDSSQNRMKRNRATGVKRNAATYSSSVNTTIRIISRLHSRITQENKSNSCHRQENIEMHL